MSSNVYLYIQLFNLKVVPKSTNKTFITKTKEFFLFLPDGLMDFRKYNVENLINVVIPFKNNDELLIALLNIYRLMKIFFARSYLLTKQMTILARDTI